MDERQANVVLTANTQQYTQQMTGAATTTEKVATSVNNLLTSLDKLAKNSGRKLEIISAATVASITGATVAAARFDSQLQTLQATAVVTGRNFNPIKTQVDDLRRSLPVTTEQVVSLATALQKLGANPSNLQKTAEVLIRLASATGEDLGQLATGMIDLQRAMGTTEGSMSKFADSLTTVSANLGVSATGVLQFSQSLAPIARTVGMTQKEVMGFSAAFLKAGQDGFTASNAFSKMLTDISRATRYGSNDLEMYANLVGKTTTEFKKMGSSDQMMALFNSINKAGPDAIKVLERMGLDGARTMRSIQGLAQSGGLQKAMEEVNAGFGNGSTKNASQEAMSGLNDTVQKLKNNLTSMAQAFGQTFLPVAEKIVAAVNSIVSAIRTVTGPINWLMGALGAGGAGVAGLAGFALSNFGMLSTVAGGMALMRSPLGAGFARGRQKATGQEPKSAIYRRSIASFEKGDGNSGQRWGYGVGQAAYRFSPLRTMDRVIQAIPGQGRNIGGRAAMLAATGWNGAMNLGRSFVSPLELNRVGNMTKRTTGDWERTKSDWQSVRSGEGATFGRAMGTAVASTGRFTASLASATAGLTRLAVTTTGSLAGRGLKSAGAGLLGLAGGPAGLAVMGGLGAFMYAGQANQAGDVFQNRIQDAQGADSSYNRYATALGSAGAAALSFASTLKKAEDQIPVDTRERALEIRQEDIQAGRVTGRELTDKSLAKMNKEQATAYMSSIFSNPDSGTDILQAAKLDLIDKFNAEGAESIISDASNRWYKPGNIIQGTSSTQQGAWEQTQGMFRPRGEFEDSLASVTSSTDILRSQMMTKFGEGEANKVTNASVNALLGQYGYDSGGSSKLTAHEEQRIASALEQQLGVESGGLGIGFGDNQALRNAGSDRERIDYFRNLVKESGNADAYDSMVKGLPSELSYNDQYRMPDPTSMPDSPMTQKLKGTMAGRQYFGGGELGGTLTTAIQNEGSENAQLSAATQWAQALTTATGSTTAASTELQRLKAAVGDASDPLYALANSAQQAASRLQGYESQYMSSPQQAQVSRDNLADAYTAPDSPDKQQRIMGAEDAYEQQRGALHNKMKSIVRSYEDFDISAARQTEDFGVSQGRQNDNQSRQVGRSNSDFRRQQRRSNSDFAVSKQRSAYDFNLQASQAYEDYNRSRQRSDEDYYLSQMRGLQDYNLQRQYSQDDFNLSRKRQEEDYQHQLVLMTQSTAKQMSDIFSRIVTVPTWDAQNLLTNAKDQNAQFSKQNTDLTQLRDMGVSSDVIKQLGLNDPKNSQQLARFVQDLAQDPSLVTTWNETIKGRLSLAEAFNKDTDNEAYTEMERQFHLAAERAVADFEKMTSRGADSYNLGIERMTKDYAKMVSRGDEDFGRSMERNATNYKTSTQRMTEDYAKQQSRGAEDYARMMARNSEDYARAMAQTVSDWQKQMGRAKEDLNRSFQETTGTFSELQKTALSRLTGLSREQLEQLLGALGEGREGVKRNADGTIKDLTNIYQNRLGVKFSAINMDANGNQINGIGFNMRVGGPDGELPATPGSMTQEGQALLNPTSDGGRGGPEGGTMSAFPVMGGYRKSSGYGMRRNPVSGIMKLHAGIDLAAPTGTGIAATEAGTVTHAGWMGGGGNVVRVNHGNGFDTWYLHMSRIGVKNGQQVGAGQRIGDVGSTGNSTGPHLHFETRYGGNPKDPSGYLAGLPHGGYSPEEMMAGGTDTSKMTPDMVNAMLAEVAQAASGTEAAQFKMPGLSGHIVPGMTTAMLGNNAMAAAASAGSLGWFGEGAIFNKPSIIGVGERGAEAVIPLSDKGADFMAMVLGRFANGQDKAHGQQTVSTKTVTYSQTVDSSVNFTGPVTVESNDPNEVGRKLEEKARMQRLTKR